MFFPPAVGGKEQIRLPSSCGIHLSGSPSSSGLCYLLEGRQQEHSVEKRQALRELIKPAESAGWEGLKDIYFALRCYTVLQGAPAEQLFYLWVPQVSYLETSHGGHAYPELCVTLGVQRLLPKSWTHAPHLVLNA